jgi:23S rRNA (uracil1939-C5)-methyltransferase
VLFKGENTMFKQTGLNDRLITEIQSLAKQYKLEKLILFGSRARGDYKQRSDIDLAATGGDVLRFALDTDELYTLLKFNVVNLDGVVQQELLDAIKTEGVVLYEKYE